MSFATRLLVGTATLIALTMPASAQGTFSGVITYQLNANGQAISIRYMSQGSKIRQEVEMPGMPGPMFMLIDVEAKKTQMVMQSMGMYMEIDMAQAMAAVPESDHARAKADVQFEKLGTSDVIAGTKCENYTFGSEAQSFEGCIASGMGWYMSPPSTGRGPKMGGGPDMTKYREYFKDGALPLRLTETTGGKRTVIMEATSVERKPLDAALFELPAGLRKMPGMGGQ